MPAPRRPIRTLTDARALTAQIVELELRVCDTLDRYRAREITGREHDEIRSKLWPAIRDATDALVARAGEAKPLGDGVALRRFRAAMLSFPPSVRERELPEQVALEDLALALGIPRASELRARRAPARDVALAEAARERRARPRDWRQHLRRGIRALRPPGPAPRELDGVASSLGAAAADSTEPFTPLLARARDVLVRAQKRRIAHDEAARILLEIDAELVAAMPEDLRPLTPRTGSTLGAADLEALRPLVARALAIEQELDASHDACLEGVVSDYEDEAVSERLCDEQGDLVARILDLAELASPSDPEPLASLAAYVAAHDAWHRSEGGPAIHDVDRALERVAIALDVPGAGAIHEAREARRRPIEEQWAEADARRVERDRALLARIADLFARDPDGTPWMDLLDAAERARDRAEPPRREALERACEVLDLFLDHEITAAVARARIAWAIAAHERALAG